MKVLITGATGFIGKNLASRIAGKGHRVIACGRSLDKLKNLTENVTPLYLSLEDKDNISKTLRGEKPDVIYHAAALIRGSRDDLMRVNRDGTRSILEAALGAGVKKVILLSSVAAITGNDSVPFKEDVPLSANGPYGESKIESEKLAGAYREKGLKIAIIRPPMVYGPLEPHGLSMLIRLLRKRILPVFGKGENRVHIVSIENLLDALEICLSKEEACEGAYFVADKEVLTLRELLFYIAECAGCKNPFTLPEGFSNFLSNLPVFGPCISSLRKDRVYSIDRLREKLGYSPRVPVRKGLKEAVLSYC